MAINAILHIENAKLMKSLYCSPLSAWELGAASQKKNINRRPDLGGLSPEIWFVEATTHLQTISVPITDAIAIAAASLPVRYGSAEPGDCLLIATAHIHQVTLPILDFARANPSYLSVIPC